MSATKKVFTLGEILNIYNVFSQIKGFTSSEFNYFINQNAYLAETVLKSYFKEEARIRDILKAFNSEKTELLERISNKDQGGKAKVTILPNGNLQYDIVGKETEYEDALVKLRDKFKKDLDEHEKQFKDCLKLLEKECPKFEPYKVKKSIIPDAVPTEVYRVFFHLIE